MVSNQLRVIALILFIVWFCAFMWSSAGKQVHAILALALVVLIVSAFASKSE
jgi:hypothetical protein